MDDTNILHSYEFHKEEMIDQKFSFQLQRAKRMEQLVNKEYLADVFFVVGGAGKKMMFGHKNILTMASEVLYAQLTGHFQEAEQNSRENPIYVADIEPMTFKQVLRFMYCDQIDLSKCNVVEIFYAAKKYLLGQLEALCLKFFENNIFEGNVLNIFNENRRYEFDVVNKVCLDVICENPIRCFQHEDFFTLEKRSLELIVQSSQINCKDQHLENAIQGWLKVHELEDGSSLSAVTSGQQRRGFMCQKLQSYNQFQYAENISAMLRLESEEKIFLYGIGIFIGTENPISEKTTARLWVVLQKTSEKSVTYSEVVPVKEALYIHEILFEKVAIDDSSACTIHVTIKTDEPRPMFCMKSFVPVHGVNCSVIVSSSGINCIAHLLYNEARYNAK